MSPSRLLSFVHLAAAVLGSEAVALRPAKQGKWRKKLTTPIEEEQVRGGNMPEGGRWADVQDSDAEEDTDSHAAPAGVGHQHQGQQAVVIGQASFSGSRPDVYDFPYAQAQGQDPYFRHGIFPAGSGIGTSSGAGGTDSSRRGLNLDAALFMIPSAAQSSHGAELPSTGGYITRGGDLVFACRATASGRPPFPDGFSPDGKTVFNLCCYADGSPYVDQGEALWQGQQEERNRFLSQQRTGAQAQQQPQSGHHQ
ncbi:unnamed protein product [Amoebophrya sp. A120]|nr:unnamed protein product [Amoebophrya sp. A120]|eukprot:GSA120T00008645001.1